MLRLPFNGQFRVSQTFGNKLILNGVDVYGRYGYLGHNGIDYALPVMTPLIAPHSGVIKEATFDPGGYGNYIKIESDSEGSVLAHMEHIDVRVGFQIVAGDLIGYSGNTGNSTGPHVHWGYYQLPRNRANGYNGFIDQTSLLAPEIGILMKFKVGDILKPDAAIPVGAKEGEEAFSYGTLSHDTPATVIGTSVWGGVHFYNIDQSAIGGGTGWVNGQLVDRVGNRPEPVPEVVVTPVPPEPVVPANSELVAQLEHERNQALEALNGEKELNADIKTVYSGFQALGFSKVEDVSAAIEKKDATIKGLNIQLSQVYARNAKLAAMVEEKEREDATAIDEGIKAMEQLGELQCDLSNIARAVDTKPTIGAILDHINIFKYRSHKELKAVTQELADVKKQVEVEAAPSPEVDPPAPSAATRFLQTLGL